MLNAWLRIILCRRLSDRNPCLKDQLEGTLGTGRFGRYKEHKHKQMKESSLE